MIKENFIIEKHGTGEKVLVKSVDYVSNSNQHVATITTEDFTLNGDYSIKISNVTDSSGVKIKENTTDNFK
ncbi:MAG TPA: hypothetical protein DIU45_09220, partial [Clostridium sp.]|nr:hypothetical protein [Clostridium sp.]